MGTVFSSTIANSLKKTLEKIITDDADFPQIFPKWLKEMSMSDHYEDDLEVGGPGLASEKPEGAEIQLGSIKEGALYRYIARTFALKLVVTEEAIEDGKYKEVVNAAKRLSRAMKKTVDVDTTLLLARGFDSNYVIGDGQPVFAASHTLPHGGTFSNIMATPMSPSRAALIVATTQIRKMPGHDGITEGYEPKKILCPVDQWAVWAEVTGSKYAPEPGQFNAINVVERLGLEVVPNKYWTNTTTNWAILTDCDGGPNIRWRRRMRSRTWVDNDNETMKYACSARWAWGISNPRSIYGVQA